MLVSGRIHPWKLTAGTQFSWSFGSDDFPSAKWVDFFRFHVDMYAPENASINHLGLFIRWFCYSLYHGMHHHDTNHQYQDPQTFWGDFGLTSWGHLSTSWGGISLMATVVNLTPNAKSPEKHKSLSWWWFQTVLIFTPKIGEDEPNLSIFFRWVGSTTN